jgi:hypothetical protein
VAASLAFPERKHRGELADDGHGTPDQGPPKKGTSGHG